MKHSCDMRSPTTADVRRDVMTPELETISIRHQILEGVDSEMLYWWFRYFCYQNLQMASGELVSAFVLWHPLNHVNFEIQKHSLSGAVGLSAGTQISIETKSRNRFLITSVGSVQALDRTGISLRFRKFMSGPAFLIDNFVDSRGGLAYASRLITTSNERKSSKESSLEQSLIRDWIEYKIQVTANLQILLPSLFKSQSKKLF